MRLDIQGPWSIQSVLCCVVLQISLPCLQCVCALLAILSAVPQAQLSPLPRAEPTAACQGSGRH